MGSQPVLCMQLKKELFHVMLQYPNIPNVSELRQENKMEGWRLGGIKLYTTKPFAKDFCITINIMDLEECLFKKVGQQVEYAT